MTQEDKELLLKDLCARLLYGVICHFRYKTGVPCYGKLTPLDIKWFLNSNIESIKPYLRPMSSMTEEENKTIKQLGILCSIKRNVNGNYERIFDGFGNESAGTQLKALDWLNVHHFDYRGLIPMGLALEAPDGMYNLKEK